MQIQLTIIIPTLNSEKYIVRTLASIKKQIYKKYIIFIADGGSSDSTLDFLKKSELNYKIISKKDSSTEDGINKCLKKIKTDYFTILGSDDFYNDKWYLDNLVKCIEEKKCDISFPDLAFFHNSQIKKKPQKTTFNEIVYKTVVPGFGWVAKNKISKYLFSTNYKIATDYDFLIRIYKKKYKFCREKKAIYCFRLGGNSGKNYFRGLKEVKEIALNHNGPKIKIYFYAFYFNIKYRLKIFLQRFLHII